MNVDIPEDFRKQIQDFEALIQTKDEELELAARLGQALVRKETKQTELLDKASARIQNLEEEVCFLREALRKDNSDVQKENESLREEIRKWEDKNYQLQYELKRKELQLEHASKKQTSEESNTSFHGNLSDKEKEIARLESKLSKIHRDHEEELIKLTEEHVSEMENLKKVNEDQLQQYVRASEEETRKLIACMESQLQALRSEIHVKFHEETMSLLSQESCNTSKNVDNEIRKRVDHFAELQEKCILFSARSVNSIRTGSFTSKLSESRYDPSSLSFSSKFSTETLDLDLDLSCEDGGEDLELPNSVEVNPSIEKEDEDGRSLEEDVNSPTSPSNYISPPPILQLASLSALHTTEEGYKSANITKEPDTAQQVSSENSTGSEKRNLSRNGIDASSNRDLSRVGAAKATLRGQVLVMMGQSRGCEKSGVSSSKTKAKCWSSRFCIYSKGSISFFRSESDATKFLDNAKGHIKPSVIWDLSKTDVRVIRKVAIQADKPNDARSSMISWLKKRNGGSSEIDDDIGKGAKGKELFKIQLVDRGVVNIDDSQRPHSTSTRSTRSGSTSTSRSFISSYSDDGGLARSEGKCSSSSVFPSTYSQRSNPESIYIAFSSEGERVRWMETLTLNAGCTQFDAGSVWIHRKQGGKKDPEWLKRFAVVNESKLEMYESGGEILRETVSLVGTKVEPAYSAHIFISHKSHQKQLVTLRAFDGTERNWWVAALRLAVNSRGCQDASSAKCKTEKLHGKVDYSEQPGTPSSRKIPSQAA